MPRCSQSLLAGRVIQKLPGNEYLISAPSGWVENDSGAWGPSNGYSSAILRLVTKSFAGPGWFIGTEAICVKNEKSPDRPVTLDNGFSKKLHVYEEWHR
jgi:hypothetical protein